MNHLDRIVQILVLSGSFLLFPRAFGAERDDLFLLGPSGANLFLVNRDRGWERQDGFPSDQVSNFEVAVAGDFDGSGWDDLFFMNRSGLNRFLYRIGSRWELGGSFDPKDVNGGELPVDDPRRTDGLDVVISIDSSQSMQSNDPNRLRIAAAKAFIDRLHPQRDRVSIVSWDSDVDFTVPLTADFGMAKGRLDSVDANGNNTDLNVGLHAAIDELLGRGASGDRISKLIYFLTDGNGNYTYSSKAGSAGARARQAGIRVFAIGLGNGTGQAELTDIAVSTGGRYGVSPDASALEQAFKQPLPWQFDYVVAGDFDGNRRTDLFFGSRLGINRIQYSQSGVPPWRRADRDNFPNQAISETQAKDADLVVSGDFDGNGTDDLYFFARTGANHFQFSIAGGGWNVGTGFDKALVDPFDFVVAGDFDGNGRDDLLFWAGGNSTVFYSRGAWQQSATPLRPYLGSYSAVIAGDFDGNGQDELFGLSANGVANDVIHRLSDLNWELQFGISGPLTSGLVMAVPGRFRDADASLKASDPNEPVTPPALQEPIPDTVLSGRDVMFAWVSPQPLDSFQLKIGDQPGGENIFAGGVLPGQTFHQSVSNLPDDSRKLYVTLLYRRTASSPWLSRPYVYTSIGKAELLTPAPGSAISDSEVTFTWRPAPTASHHLKVGRQRGGAELLDTGVISDDKTSAVAKGLPVDGTPIYVSLLYRYSSFSSWVSVDYTFGTERKPELLSPLPGTVLDAPPILFQWNAHNNPVAAWRLTLGTERGGSNIFDSAELPGTLTSQSVNQLSIDGSVLHVTLAYKTAGVSQWVSIPYQYGFLTLESYEAIIKALNDPLAAAEIGIDSAKVKNQIKLQTAELVADIEKKLEALQGSGRDAEELKLLSDLFNLHILSSTPADLTVLLQRALGLMRKLAGAMEEPRGLAKLYTRVARVFEMLAQRAQPPQSTDLLKLAAEAYELAARGLASALRSTSTDHADFETIKQALADHASRAVQVGSSRVDLQACKLEYSIVSPK